MKSFSKAGHKVTLHYSRINQEYFLCHTMHGKQLAPTLFHWHDQAQHAFRRKVEFIQTITSGA